MTSFVSSRRTSATGYRPNAPAFHAKVQTNHDPFIHGRTADTDAEVGRRRQPIIAECSEPERVCIARVFVLRIPHYPGGHPLVHVEANPVMLRHDR